MLTLAARASGGWDGPESASSQAIALIRRDLLTQPILKKIAASVEEDSNHSDDEADDIIPTDTTPEQNLESGFLRSLSAARALLSSLEEAVGNLVAQRALCALLPCPLTESCLESPPTVSSAIYLALCRKGVITWAPREDRWGLSDEEDRIVRTGALVAVASGSTKVLVSQAEDGEEVLPSDFYHLHIC